MIAMRLLCDCYVITMRLLCDCVSVFGFRQVSLSDAPTVASYTTRGSHALSGKLEILYCAFEYFNY